MAAQPPLGPSSWGWMGAAAFIYCPGLEEEKTSQVSKEVSGAWLGAGLLATNPSLAVCIYIIVCINSLPSSPNFFLIPYSSVWTKEEFWLICNTYETAGLPNNIWLRGKSV